jgi:hypothetical protein
MNMGSGSVPQLKGARRFSYEELEKYTNNFSEANGIGSGGYGKANFHCLSSESNHYLHTTLVLRKGKKKLKICFSKNFF